MALLKQKTVRVGNEKQRIGLKKLKNDMDFGGRHKYEIVDLDTGELIEDPYTNKREAKREFRATVDQIERGMRSNSGGGEDLGIGSTDSLLDPFDDDGIL